MVNLAEGGNWLKESEVKDGDIIAFVNSGEWQESQKFTYDDGNPVKQFVIKVKYDNSEYSLTLNKMSRTNMVALYGSETEGWIGKKAKITKVKVMAGGKMKTSLVLDSPDGKVVTEDSPFNDDFGV